MKQNISLSEDFRLRQNFSEYVGKNCVICCEDCLNGCDVAVYKKNHDLLEPKQCANLKGFMLEETPSRQNIEDLVLFIDKWINIFYKKYELLNTN